MDNEENVEVADISTSEVDAPALTETYGAKAVGLSFNPGGSGKVDFVKQEIAKVIDLMNDLRGMEGTSGEQKRLYSVAITELQGAQMWAVKALTWKD